MQKPNAFIKMFFKTGDPFCFLLAKDEEKTEKLREEILSNVNDDLTL